MVTFVELEYCHETQRSSTTEGQYALTDLQRRDGI